MECAATNCEDECVEDTPFCGPHLRSVIKALSAPTPYDEAGAARAGAGLLRVHRYAVIYRVGPDNPLSRSCRRAVLDAYDASDAQVTVALGQPDLKIISVDAAPTAEQGDSPWP